MRVVGAHGCAPKSQEKKDWNPQILREAQDKLSQILTDYEL